MPGLNPNMDRESFEDILGKLGKVLEGNIDDDNEVRNTRALVTFGQVMSHWNRYLFLSPWISIFLSFHFVNIIMHGNAFLHKPQ